MQDLNKMSKKQDEDSIELSEGIIPTPKTTNYIQVQKSIVGDDYQQDDILSVSKDYKSETAVYQFSEINKFKEEPGTSTFTKNEKSKFKS